MSHLHPGTADADSLGIPLHHSRFYKYGEMIYPPKASDMVAPAKIQESWTIDSTTEYVAEVYQYTNCYYYLGSATKFVVKSQATNEVTQTLELAGNRYSATESPAAYFNVTWPCQITGMDFSGGLTSSTGISIMSGVYETCEA